MPVIELNSSHFHEAAARVMEQFAGRPGAEVQCILCAAMVLLAETARHPHEMIENMIAMLSQIPGMANRPLAIAVIAECDRIRALVSS